MQLYKRLPKDKQDRILNAAYESFARHGYRRTSIGGIADNAGISKASLFHYFGSKRELYCFLYQHGIQTLSDMVAQNTDRRPDLFKRMLMIMRIKLRAAQRYPAMFDFLMASLAEDDAEIAAEKDVMYQAYLTSGFDALLEGIDWSRLAPEASRDMVQNIIAWVGDGYIRVNMGRRSIDDMAEDMERYLSLLKRSLYRSDES